MATGPGRSGPRPDDPDSASAQITDADGEQPPCWHTEPGTPCDWDACRQPERLANGDRGTDPAADTTTED
jgi:hypothetical protein